MATKTATKKTTKTARKAVRAKAPAVRVGLYREKYPEKHQATGKYKFFYALFACTTLIFAAVAVWLFVFSSEILSKYESIQVCARNGETCEVSVEEQEKVEETTNTENESEE